MSGSSRSIGGLATHGKHVECLLAKSPEHDPPVAYQLEEENGKLKKIVADLSLDKEMLQDVIRRKL